MILILSLSPLVDIVSQGLGPCQSQSKEWNEHDVQFEGRSCREQELEARRNCMRERGRLGLSERDGALFIPSLVVSLLHHRRIASSLRSVWIDPVVCVCERERD